MLNALLIANAGSGTSHKLDQSGLPGQWILDPASVTAENVRNAELIALLGGDGTIQKTLSQLLQEISPTELPPLAVLPFGTTNMTARALNRTHNRQAAVKNLERAIHSGSFGSQMRSLVQIRRGTRSEYGFFFGAGVIAQAVERWNEERQSGAIGNQARSLWAMITGLSGISSETAMSIDGTNHRVYGLLASTLDKLLFGSRPYWCDSQPGDLHLTWVESNATGLLKHAPSILRGKPRMAGVSGYESHVAQSVELKFDGSYIIDGEIFSTDDQTLTICRSEPIRWLTL